MAIHIRKIRSSLLLVAGAAGFATPAWAQDAARAPAQQVAASGQDDDDAGARNEEIVVTALKDKRTVHETPATVQVLTSTDLADRGITSVLDLPRVVPALSITPSTLGNNAVRLYGLGTPASALAFDQSVLPVLDGAPASHSRAFQASLFDVANVQVIKGVQAAVLGKNSSIGAVAITSRRPGDQFEYNFSTSYEVALGSAYADGGVTVPMGSNLSMRVAGRFQHTGGWVHNDSTGLDGPDARSEAVRGTLVWQPSANFEYSVLGEFSNTRTEGNAYELYLDRTGTGALACAAAGATNCEFKINRHTQATDLTTWGGVNNVDKLKSTRIVGTGQLDLGPITVTSVTSVQGLQTHTIVDADRLPGGFFTPRFIERSRTVTQEVRFSSNGSGPFRYLFGGYFGHDIYSLDSYAQWNTINGRTAGATGTNDQYHRQVTNDYSAFGQISVAPVEGLRISGGLRYNHMDKVATPRNTLIVAGTYSSIAQPPFPEQHFTKSEDAVDYSIAAQLDVNPNLMIYASYGKGSKSGGFSTGGKYVGVYNPATTPALIYSSTVYRPEIAYITEGGVKLNLPGFGYFNASIYNVEVKDAQQSFSTGGTIVFISRDLTSRGANLEAVQRPIRGLSIYENVNYSDFGRDRTVDAPLIKNPRWSGNVGFDYQLPVSNAWTGTFGLNLTFRSNQYETQPGGGGDVRETFGPVQVLSGKFKLANSNGWEVALIGDNLLDNVVVTSALSATGVSGIQIATDRPRTVLLRLSYSH